MTGSGRLGVGDAVFDRDRQARGEVIDVYPSPLVVRPVDDGGFQWTARTVACERAGGQAGVSSHSCCDGAVALTLGVAGG